MGRKKIIKHERNSDTIQCACGKAPQLGQSALTLRRTKLSDNRFNDLLLMRYNQYKAMVW